MFDATDLVVIAKLYLTSTDDLANRGQSYLLWPFVHHGLYTGYRIILVVDLNISDVGNLKKDYHLSPDSRRWPWKSRSNIFLNDLHYLWLNTCYRLDFSIPKNAQNCWNKYVFSFFSNSSKLSRDCLTYNRCKFRNWGWCEASLFGSLLRLDPTQCYKENTKSSIQNVLYFVLKPY